MIFYVIGAIVIVLFILLLVNMLLMRNKLNRLAKKYKYFMNGEDGGSLELRLSTEVRELREMVSSSENMLHQQELLATMQLSSFQKVGLVRYDAFDDTGDKLSFSLTVPSLCGFALIFGAILLSEIQLPSAKRQRGTTEGD